ncbi:MAG: nucleoside triphosphate pyrophosphohydrolase [Candidatus Falkowbacteria bacterium]
MKVYKFKYEKLVRDMIPTKIKKSGGKVKQKTLSTNKYIYELKRKLIEEGEELLVAKNTKDTLDEMADIQELIDCLLVSLGKKTPDLKKLQKEKNKKNGSFKDKIYINNISADENFDWLDYHLKNKQKYPLI